MKIATKQISIRPQVKTNNNPSLIITRQRGSKPIARSLSHAKNVSLKLGNSNVSPVKRTKQKGRNFQSIQQELKPIKEKPKKSNKNNGGKSDKKKKQKQKDKDKEKDKENENIKKKKTNFINLKQLKPLNLQKEKELFFENETNYNPFFLYPNISDLNDEQYKDMKKYETPDEAYLPLVLKILEKSKKVHMHHLLVKNSPLSEEKTAEIFTEYINKLEIGQLLSFQFSANTIAPTSVVHNNQENISKVIISTPINYREETIYGVMNHEIGTHFLRKFNDRGQKWYKDRKKYNLSPFLKTEEGLAAINQILSYFSHQKIPPLLYRPALMYYCCYLASRYSFSEMFAKLEQFEPNPQIRWRQCVRVKRGIADTSKPCGMYKDQIYFLGAVQILKNRKKLDFIGLHCGKINVQDCLRLTEKGIINTKQKIKIPFFLNDLKYYLECLDKIAEVNQIS